MYEKAREQINDLKMIRAEMIRNAEHLDNVITKLERDLMMNYPPKKMSAFLSMRFQMRKAAKSDNEWDLLDDREEMIFTQLLDGIH